MDPTSLFCGRWCGIWFDVCGLWRVHVRFTNDGIGTRCEKPRSMQTVDCISGIFESRSLPARATANDIRPCLAQFRFPLPSTPLVSHICSLTTRRESYSQFASFVGELLHWYTRQLDARCTSLFRIACIADCSTFTSGWAHIHWFVFYINLFGPSRSTPVFRASVTLVSQAETFTLAICCGAYFLACYWSGLGELVPCALHAEFSPIHA